MADALSSGAQRDLLVRVEGSPSDPCIWEHSERVARIAEQLCDIPELRGRPIEREALQVAALYHDAGWVLQVGAGDCHARDILLKPSNDLQREMAADWMTERVAKLVGAGVIQQAARILRQMNNRRTDVLEARILADAENLDEIGPHSICLMVRKICAEGKGLSDIISLWDRQNEYRYWPARIKEGFHFDATRQLAGARLERLARLMNDLREVISLDDVTALVTPRRAPASR